MATRRARCITLVLLTMLVGAWVNVTPADARRRKRVRARKKTRPPGYAAAKRQFLAGVQLFNDGDYNGAIARFQASLKQYRNPKALARIALCYKWLGNQLKALAYYEKFLQEFPAQPARSKDRRLRREVEKTVSSIRQRLARLTIRVPGPAGADVRLDGRSLGKAPFTRTLPRNPGAAHIIVTAPGHYPFRRDLVLRPRQHAVVPVQLIKIKIEVVRKVIRVRETPFYERWWFWTVVGAVLAGGAAGIAVGLTWKPPTQVLSGYPLQLNNLARW